MLANNPSAVGTGGFGGSPINIAAYGWDAIDELNLVDLAHPFAQRAGQPEVAREHSQEGSRSTSRTRSRMATATARATTRSSAGRTPTTASCPWARRTTRGSSSPTPRRQRAQASPAGRRDRDAPRGDGARGADAGRGWRSSVPAMLSEDQPYLFGRRRTLLVVTGVVMGIFVASINQAMLIVSVPKIVGDLGGLQSFAWIFTIYFLSSTVTIPIWGKLSDQYGRRPLLRRGRRVLPASARSPARWPRRSRCCSSDGRSRASAPAASCRSAWRRRPTSWPRASAASGSATRPACCCCAQLGGPALGGLITDTAGWRWAFLISLPFGLVSLAIIWFGLKIPANAQPPQARLCRLASCWPRRS